MSTPLASTRDFLAPVALPDRPLVERLIAIADTKLVLGNWHLVCLHNAKSLPDYAALLAMASASFGHARALYDYLGGFGLDYALLERGRKADALHSQAMLDAPPDHWQDLVTTAHLADQAAWLQISRYLAHPDRILSGLARRIGEETYFHQKWVHGWLAQFARDGAAVTRTRDALLRRYPQGLAWFAPAAGETLAQEQRQLFVQAAQEVLERLGTGGALPSAADVAVHGPHAPLKRQVPVPDALYERIRFKDAEAVP